MKNNFLHTIKYIITDIFGASLAWILFMYYRIFYLDKSIFTIKNEYINITDNKKSNAYKLRHIPSGRWIIVVNIHLKASIGVLSGVHAAAQGTYPGERDEEQRRYEIANIYSIMRSYLGERSNIPIYFGGDWNSEWTRETKINHFTLVEIDRIIEDFNEKDNPEYTEILHHLISKNPDIEPIGLLG